MRVLVVEDVATVAQPTIERLLDAGFDVARCSDPGAPGFPCKGLHETPACPLDDEAVDVAVVVRGAARESPTSREAGARCALRRHIPLVEVGEHAASPYLRFLAGVSSGPEHVVAVVSQTAAATLPTHGLEAERVFREVLDGHDLGCVTVAAEVHRRQGSLSVRLLPDREISKRVADVAVVRVCGAVRALDPDAVTIGVSVHPVLRSEP